MRNIYKLFLFTIPALLITLSCNDDNGLEADGLDILRAENFIFFKDDSPITLSEGGGVVEIPILLNKRSASPVNVVLSVEDPLGSSGSANFNIVNSNDQPVVEANKTFALLLVEAPDDQVFQETRDVKITLEAIPTEGVESGIQGLGIKNSITITVKNNDTFSAIGGNYVASSSNAFEGPSSSPVAVTLTDEIITFTAVTFNDEVARFKVSDVTFGFYPQRYGIFGAGPVPGVIVHYRADNSIEIITDESPDPFFGDNFSGSGTYNPATGNMQISWDDLYGDKADVSLTPQ